MEFQTTEVAKNSSLFFCFTENNKPQWAASVYDIKLGYLKDSK